MKKIVILYSGGLDSFIMHKLATSQDADVKCIYYAHGCAAEEQELTTIPNFVEVRKIDWLNDNITAKEKTGDFAGAIYIPGRNLVFSALAASQELPDEVWMGTQIDEIDESATDKSMIFKKKTSELLSYVLSPFIPNGVNVVFPFVDRRWNKVQSVKWALENGVSKEELISTVSCWNPSEEGLPCGECRQCFKRYFVFGLNGFSEPYKSTPLQSDASVDMLRIYLNIARSKNVTDPDAKNVIWMIKTAIKTHPHLIPDNLKNEVNLALNENKSNN